MVRLVSALGCRRGLRHRQPRQECSPGLRCGGLDTASGNDIGLGAVLGLVGPRRQARNQFPLHLHGAGVPVVKSLDAFIHEVGVIMVKSINALAGSRRIQAAPSRSGLASFEPRRCGDVERGIAGGLVADPLANVVHARHGSMGGDRAGGGEAIVRPTFATS
jgi:hypothetical protein